MTLLQSIFLGLLQGATEFLPVSSSGHLAIAQHYLPGFSQPGVLFDVLLHLGTMVAVIIYFRSDIMNLASSPFRRDDKAAGERRMLLLLVIGSVPTAVIGLAGKDLAVGLFENLTVVASMLLVTGLLLAVAEKFRAATGRPTPSVGDAILTGIAQGLAIIPGISRSGATIATLLLRGVDGEAAARFSFLLALPAVFGAALLSLEDISRVPAGEIPIYLAGAVVALVAGLLSIHFLLAIIRRRRLIFFALYCWAVGLTFLGISL